jgi:hypothetical protein
MRLLRKAAEGVGRDWARREERSWEARSIMSGWVDVDLAEYRDWRFC